MKCSAFKHVHELASVGSLTDWSSSRLMVAVEKMLSTGEYEYAQVWQRATSYNETRSAQAQYDRPYSISDSRNSVSLYSWYCSGIPVWTVRSSTRSSRHCLRSSDSNKLVMPPVKPSTYHNMDGVLLLHQAQLCGTASPNTSETQHYPLIRLGAILIHTFCSILIYIRRLSALETLWLHALYKLFYCDFVIVITYGRLLISL